MVLRRLCGGCKVSVVRLVLLSAGHDRRIGQLLLFWGTVWVWMCTEWVWRKVGVCVNALWRAVLQVYGVVRGRVDLPCALYIASVLHCC
jgi:hypothetical protein